MIEMPANVNLWAKTVSVFCLIFSVFLYLIGVLNFENFVQFTIFSLLLLFMELFFDSGFTQLPERLLDMMDYNQSKSNPSRIILSICVAYPLSISIISLVPSLYLGPILILTAIISIAAGVSSIFRSYAPIDFFRTLPQLDLSMPVFCMFIFISTSLAIGFVSNPENDSTYLAIKQNESQSVDIYDSKFETDTDYFYSLEIFSNSNENLSVQIELEFISSEVGVVNESKILATFSLNFTNQDLIVENFTASYNRGGLHRITANLYEEREEKIQIRQVSVFVNVEV